MLSGQKIKRLASEFGIDLTNTEFWYSHYIGYRVTTTQTSFIAEDLARDLKDTAKQTLTRTERINAWIHDGGNPALLAELFRD